MTVAERQPAEPRSATGRIQVLRVGPAPVASPVQRPPRRAAPPATPAPETLLVQGPEVRCAFCHAGFEPSDAPLFCAGCRALQHGGCWREAGRCPSLGCPGPGPGARPARRGVAILAAVLHGLTLTPWALGALLVLPPGANLVVVVTFLAVVALLVLPRLPRADASWLLALSGFSLAATLVFVLAQSQRAFLAVS